MIEPRAFGQATAAAVLLAAVAAPVHAFDDSRQGFVIGIGLGGHTSAHEPDDAPDGRDRDRGGLAAALQIGFGLTDRFSLFYLENGVLFTEGDDDLLSGLSGVGARYHLSAGRPSAFLQAGYGYASLDNLDDERASTASGRSLLLGAGYEFSNRLGVEALMTRSTVDGGFVGGTERDIDSVQLLASYSWY